MFTWYLTMFGWYFDDVHVVFDDYQNLIPHTPFPTPDDLALPAPLAAQRNQTQSRKAGHLELALTPSGPVTAELKGFKVHSTGCIQCVTGFKMDTSRFYGGMNFDPP